jgi:hypothetical protein
MRGMVTTLLWRGLPAMAALSLHAAVIRGTVVEDASGRPLARATVTVEAVGRNSDLRAVTSDTVALAQQRHPNPVRTNASGIFEFASLPAGTYRISASKLEFVTVLYGQKRWYSPGMPIVLEAGDDASLSIRMQRFGAITGTLLDENDVGLPDCDVAVYTNTRPPKLLARATTDDRGIYRLFNLSPGSYLVRSLARQYEDESYLPTFYRDSPTVDPRNAVEVKLDEEVGKVDFHAATGRLLTVSGRVNTAFGDAIVTLTSDAGTETATVDGRGNYTFKPMAPGTYELLADVPSDRARPRMASFQMLTVDRDLTDVRVAPGPLPTVQFVFEDTAGHPLMMPEGSLTARRKDAAGESDAQPIPSAVTLLPGRWEIAVTPGPSYCVAGFVAPQQESAGEGRYDGWNEIALASGSQNIVKFVLSPSPAAIGGAVKNAGGDAVAGVPVFVEPYDLDPRRRLSPARTTTTDADGKYNIGGLAPGVYRLLASFDYAMPGPAQMEAAQAKTVKVDAAGRAVLDLEEFVIR